MNAFLSSDPIRLDDVSFMYPHISAVKVLRLDEIHPVISGNKWFKLRYYVADATEKRAAHIVTWGGPWSNHIIATAAVCAQAGFSCTGLIRGDEPSDWPVTLQQAQQYNMQLRFLSREEYDAGKIPEAFRGPDYYFIPSGGYGEKGALGAATILDGVDEEFNTICCAVGTGTMLAGLSNGSCREQQLIGISVLKNHPELDQEVEKLVKTGLKNWRILRDYHHGGYAKHSPALLQFMNNFYEKTGIPSDFVYTGKLFYAAHSLIHEGYFPDTAKILLIHSGGLQGNASLAKSVLTF